MIIRKFSRKIIIVSISLIIIGFGISIVGFGLNGFDINVFKKSTPPKWYRAINTSF